mgnify:CR=1 FL=1
MARAQLMVHDRSRLQMAAILVFRWLVSMGFREAAHECAPMALAQKHIFVSALASVVGVNSRDVVVMSMANGGSNSAGAKHWLQMRLRINQVRARSRPHSDAFVAAHTDTFPLSAILFAIKATRAKAQAMIFFMI